jgi:hypothetical protein
VELRRLCTRDNAAEIVEVLEAIKDRLLVSLIDQLAKVMKRQKGLEFVPLMRKLLARCRTTEATAAGLATCMQWAIDVGSSGRRQMGRKNRNQPFSRPWKTKGRDLF